MPAPSPRERLIVGTGAVVALVVGGYLAWKNRVAIIAAITGQDQSRIRRQLGRGDRR